MGRPRLGRRDGRDCYLAISDRVPLAEQRCPHTKPIGEVRVGERTNAHNPKGDFDDRFGVDVDSATWRQIILRAEKESGGNCRIELLRPLWWLDLNQAKAGGRIHISIPECGVNDEALVLSIGPCPKIQPGDGPIITGKFIHDAAQVIDIYIEGQPKPIGSTPNHRFWSVDRQEPSAPTNSNPAKPCKPLAIPPNS